MLSRRLLLYIAERPSVRGFILRSRASRAMSRRFVAGETVDDALRAAQGVNAQGFSATLDYLGENVTTQAEADAACAVYTSLLDEIQSRGLNSNVSVKLTQMGLDLSFERCLERVDTLVARAAGYNNFVRIDMEGSAYTERTLQIVHALRKRHENVGGVVQSYLYRSKQDVEELLATGTRIRLCKGAYQEPPEVAYQRKSEVDANYVRLMRMLLSSGVYNAIATHDPHMIGATIDYAVAHKLPPSSWEFQMLYGIRRDLQAQLVRDGYRMRIYIPFGSQWFPYLTRRLAERPANLLFFAKNLVRG